MFFTTAIEDKVRSKALSEVSENVERLGGRQIEVRDAATRLFYERGYHGTSLRDIAKKLGLQAPSLYNHISSKQQLLQDVMFDNTLSLRAAIDSAIATTDDLVEQIRQAAEALTLHCIRHRFQVHVSMSELASVDEPARTQLLRLRMENTNRWHTMIEKGVQTGVFDTQNVRLAALSIIDLAAGLAHTFRPEGMFTESELVLYHGDLALKIVGAELKGPTIAKRSTKKISGAKTARR